VRSAAHCHTQVYVLISSAGPCQPAPAASCTLRRWTARAYHKRPELTAATFVPNPFVKDRVPALQNRTWCAGSRRQLEFSPHGRPGKIRGFRVEPGDETVLRATQSNEAIVVAREDSFGTSICGLRRCQERELLGRHLRGYLQQKLPSSWCLRIHDAEDVASHA